MKYFKHDSDARTDAKLKKVMLKYGLVGYGLYFFCLEMIAANIEKHNLTFELEHDAEILAHESGLHIDVVQEMMTYFISLKLFEQNNGIITCLKLATRTDEYTQKLIRSLGGLPTNSGQTPDKLQIKSGLKEKKRREEKRKTEQTFSPPSEKEVEEYAKEIKSKVLPFDFVDYYQTQGWLLSNGRKMKCWKSAFRRWTRKECESKPTQEYDHGI